MAALAAGLTMGLVSARRRRHWVITPDPTLFFAMGIRTESQQVTVLRADSRMTASPPAIGLTGSVRPRRHDQERRSPRSDPRRRRRELIQGGQVISSHPALVYTKVSAESYYLTLGASSDTAARVNDSAALVQAPARRKCGAWRGRRRGCGRRRPGRTRPALTFCTVIHLAAIRLMDIILILFRHILAERHGVEA